MVQPSPIPYIDGPQTGGNYPFVDSASLQSQDGSLSIAGLFTDARIMTPDVISAPYISSISWDGNTMTINVSVGTSTPLVGTYTPLTSGSLINLTDSAGRPGGVLVLDVEQAPGVASTNSNSATFLPAATQFVATCVIPETADGVTGFLLPDGSTVSGDVWFVGENGVVLGWENGELKVQLVGDPYFTRVSCEGATNLPYIPPVPLATINGMQPNAIGDFAITTGVIVTADNVLHVTSAANILNFTLSGGSIA